MAGIVAMVVVLVLSLASSAFATSVTSPLLVLTNYTAQDTGMTYSVAFITPHALTKGSSKVILQGPDGTTFGNCKKEACKVSVEHGGSGGSVTSGAVSKASVSHGGHRVKIKMPVSASAGDRVIVHIPGSTNSSEPGPQTAVLSTSADKTGVSLAFDLSPVVDIAQVRPNGPGGANDSFVELYAGGPKVSLSGWTLKSIAPGGAQTTLVAFKKQQLNTNVDNPNDFLLAAGSTYSLGSYAAPDVTYSPAIPANGAVALYDDTGALVDSVVFGSGTELASTGVLGSYSNSGEQYAFLRKLNLQPGLKSGAPLYTGHNASDFTLVAPEATNPLTENSPLGTGSALTAFEGAPGPHDLGSSVIENPNFSVSLLSGTNAGAAPNTEVKTESASPHATKALYLRRTITYHGLCKVGDLRLRVATITSDSNPAPSPGQAILRALGNPNTTEGAFTFAPSTLGSTDGPDGGGLNSSLSLPGAELASGQSVNVAVKLGVQRSGNYQFFFNVEGSTVGFC
jgi:hypothetical protein